MFKQLLCVGPLLALTLISGVLRAQVVQGTLDKTTSSTCEAAGWARDPTNPNPIQVSLYKDADATSGTLIATFVADQLRTDLPFPDQNHGFDQVFALNPVLADGKTHAIYAYGVTASGASGPLNGNGMTIQCTSIGSTMSANIRDYGAKGDGITDDSNAIQAALDDTLPGGTVFVPGGTYMLGTGHYFFSYGQPMSGVSGESYALKLSKEVTFQGEGRTSILKLMPVRLGIGYFLDGNFLVEKMVFDGNNGARFLVDPTTGMPYPWPLGNIVDALWNGSNDNNDSGSKVFRDCEFRNALEDGTGRGSVQNSYIHNNGGFAVDPSLQNQDGGVAISINFSNQSATDNVIVGNTNGAPRWNWSQQELRYLTT